MTWEERIANYSAITKFSQSLFIGEDGRVVGTWIMGNNYKGKQKYYGEYPAGYLKRIKALFPIECQGNVLHLFSGVVDLSIIPEDTVDINPELNPTFINDAMDLSNVPVASYDLILADPPYSVEDSEHYGPTMIKRNKVMKALSSAKSRAYVVWLDQVLPMYRKDTWAIEGVIGMVKSTNHRFRVITIFRRL